MELVAGKAISRHPPWLCVLGRAKWSRSQPALHILPHSNTCTWILKQQICRNYFAIPPVEQCLPAVKQRVSTTTQLKLVNTDKKEGTVVSWCSQFSIQHYVRRTVYICRPFLFLLRVVLNTKLSVGQLNTKIEFLPPMEQKSLSAKNNFWHSSWNKVCWLLHIRKVFGSNPKLQSPYYDWDSFDNQQSLSKLLLR
jgi:hypothetical protein